MIKSVGLILLFLSSVATGVYIANKKRAELALHKSNFKMLTEIKNTLRFNQSNKSKIYANLRQNGYGDCLDNYKNNAILKGYLDYLDNKKPLTKEEIYYYTNKYQNFIAKDKINQQKQQLTEYDKMEQIWGIPSALHKSSAHSHFLFWE